MTVLSTDINSLSSSSRISWPSAKYALPAFLRPGGLSRTRKLSATAYLDALRGWAALIVVFYHSGKADGRPFWQLPLVHILDAGHSMVYIFFVISGYVLSYRMLTLTRNQDLTRLYESLAGSIFRRWFRLFLPTGFASLLVALYIQFTSFAGPVGRFDSLIHALWFWFNDFLVSSNPLSNVRGYWHPYVFRTIYLDQMWTIPVEYRGSLFLFFHCAICGRMDYRTRTRYTIAMILLCYYWEIVYVALFLFGMLIADYSLGHPLDSTSGSIGLPTDTRPSTPRSTSSLSSRLTTSIFLFLSLFLLSQPDFPRPLEDPRPWPALYHLIPAWWEAEGRETFWASFGAVGLVFILDRNPALQTPLRWPFSQYLGELSFGMYATHLPISWTVDQQWLKPWTKKQFGEEKNFVVDVVTFAFMVFIVLWVADYFTRVDRLFVKFGHWLQGKLFLPSAGGVTKA